MFLAQAGTIAQTSEDLQYQHDLCIKKIQRYTSMKNTGIVMTVGGGAMAIGGIILFSNSLDDLNEYNNTYYAEGDEGANAFVGLLMAELGVGIAAGGIVLWTIGSSKVRKYTNKMNSLSFNLNDDPRRALSLTYRF